MQKTISDLSATITRPVEIMVGLATLLTGARMLASYPADLSVYPSMHGFIEMMPAWCWGVALLLAGTAQIVVSWLLGIAARKHTAMLSLIVRAVMFITMLRGSCFDPALISTMFVLVLSVWTYYQLPSMMIEDSLLSTASRHELRYK